MIPERRVLCEDKTELLQDKNDITSAVYPAGVGKISTLLGQVLLQLWGFVLCFLTQQSCPLKGAEVTALRRE